MGYIIYVLLHKYINTSRVKCDKALLIYWPAHRHSITVSSHKCLILPTHWLCWTASYGEQKGIIKVPHHWPSLEEPMGWLNKIAGYSVTWYSLVCSSKCVFIWPMEEWNSILPTLLWESVGQWFRDAHLTHIPLWHWGNDNVAVQVKKSWRILVTVLHKSTWTYMHVLATTKQNIAKPFVYSMEYIWCMFGVQRVNGCISPPTSVHDKGHSVMLWSVHLWCFPCR